MSTCGEEGAGLGRELKATGFHERGPPDGLHCQGGRKMLWVWRLPELREKPQLQAGEDVKTRTVSLWKADLASRTKFDTLM